MCGWGKMTMGWPGIAVFRAPCRSNIVHEPSTWIRTCSRTPSALPSSQSPLCLQLDAPIQPGLVPIRPLAVRDHRLGSAQRRPLPPPHRCQRREPNLVERRCPRCSHWQQKHYQCEQRGYSRRLDGATTISVLKAQQVAGNAQHNPNRYANLNQGLGTNSRTEIRRWRL